MLFSFAAFWHFTKCFTRSKVNFAKQSNPVGTPVGMTSARSANVKCAIMAAQPFDWSIITRLVCCLRSNYRAVASCSTYPIWLWIDRNPIRLGEFNLRIVRRWSSKSTIFFLFETDHLDDDVAVGGQNTTRLRHFGRLWQRAGEGSSRRWLTNPRAMIAAGRDFMELVHGVTEGRVKAYC